ncbi:MAG: alpha/beta hydrolase [bacterium]|nr:alpha/beta hydrolase [bacterium]
MSAGKAWRTARARRALLGGAYSSWRVLRSLALAYIVLAVVAIAFPYWLIFQPPRASYAAHDPGVLFFNARDGTRIAAMYFPAKEDRPTLLYVHGNAEDIGMLRPLFARIHELGYGVFAYDYRSYGLSTGRPTEANTYADAEAAFAYLTNQLGIPPTRIVVHGRSLGGAVAVHLALTCRPAAAILESTFVSAYRVLTRIPLFPGDKFCSLPRVAQITCPVFLIHGTADWIVRPWHGRTLYAAIRAPKQAWWVEGAGHNDILDVTGDDYFKRLDVFLRTTLPRGGTQAPGPAEPPRQAAQEPQ